MPSLVRFLIVIVFLAGLVVGGMMALTIFVDPQPKDVVMKIPARELFGDS